MRIFHQKKNLTGCLCLSLNLIDAHMNKRRDEKHITNLIISTPRKAEESELFL